MNTPMTYLSLLRGINIGGRKKIRMQDLAQLYEAMGFLNVRTYIQSGNVIFEAADEDGARVASRIEDGIRRRYGFDVRVLIKTAPQMRRVLDDKPFDDERIFVTFLFQTPQHIPIDELNRVKQLSEQFHIAGDIVYFFCPDGYGRTKLSNNFLEAKLKVAATTRNWKSVRALHELMGYGGE